MKGHIFLLLAAVTTFGFSAGTLAEVPHLISYQGRLTDSNGAPVPDGSYSVKFKVYGSPAGNDSLWWSNFETLEVTDGLFHYQLGSTNPFPNDLFSVDTARYLAIQINGEPEMIPRTKLVSVPYAYHSLRADTANIIDVPFYGTGDFDYVPLISLTNANIDGFALEAKNSGSQAQVIIASKWFAVEAKTGDKGAWLGSADAGIAAWGTTGFAGHFQGRVGIGDVAPDAQLEVGELLRVQGMNYSSAIYPDSGSGLEITYNPNNALGIIQAYDRDASTFGNLALLGDSVGIGTTAPLERLHVNGKVYVGTMDATSGGSVVRWENNRLKRETSSARFKDNIRPLAEDFAKILRVAPKSFVDRGSGQEHMGFIAEEFEQSGLEKLVIHDAEGQPDGIRYELISVYLLEMVKELKAENKELRARLETLERR
jgi:Chaperone of endosialidase